jgi:cytochrome c556
MRYHIFPAIALSALTALTLPVAADAQARPPGQGRMGEHMGSGPGTMPAARIIELREELGLTADQVERISGIQEQLRERNGPLLEQLAAARQEMQADRRQLTDEERAQMQERREAMRDSMRSREALPDSMRGRAPMTAEQRQQMRAQMQERRDQGMRARREGAMRSQTGIPAELHPVMEQLRANTDAARQQIEATLTAEQQQKLRELRPSPGRPAGQRERGPGADRGRAPAASRGAR